MPYEVKTMEFNFKCPECNSNGLLIIPTDHGWKVQCHKSHEVFPHPGKVLVVRPVQP